MCCYCGYFRLHLCGSNWFQHSTCFPWFLFLLTFICTHHNFLELKICNFEFVIYSTASFDILHVSMVIYYYWQPYKKRSACFIHGCFLNNIEVWVHASLFALYRWVGRISKLCSFLLYCWIMLWDTRIFMIFLPLNQSV